MLGFWQLERERDKENILQQFAYMGQSSVKNLDDLDTADFSRLAQYEPLTIQGQPLNQQNFLLDNRSFEGRVGYDVITPLMTTKGVVLVNRGWIAQGASRRQLPEIAAINESVTWQGYVYRPIKASLLLGANEDNPGQWPRVIQRLDFAAMAMALNQSVADFVLRLDATAEHGFVREWPPINMSPAKHRMYAVQWFTFAAILGGLFLILRIRRSKHA